MRNKKLLVLIVFVLIALTVTGYVYFSGAKHTIQDDALYKWVTSQQDMVYYKNDPSILPTSEETERAHDNFMRIKFNKTALSVLDAESKLPKGTEFPDSSVIIKEIFSDKGANPELLAVMVKLKGAENSAKKWLWAEYSPNGDVEYSVTKEGKICTGCHKPGDDYVRIFDIVK
jgi:hypothetical protein